MNSDLDHKSKNKKHQCYSFLPLKKESKKSMQNMLPDEVYSEPPARSKPEHTYQKRNHPRPRAQIAGYKPTQNFSLLLPPSLSPTLFVRRTRRRRGAGAPLADQSAKIARASAASASSKEHARG